MYFQLDAGCVYLADTQLNRVHWGKDEEGSYVGGRKELRGGPRGQEFHT